MNQLEATHWCDDCQKHFRLSELDDLQEVGFGGQWEYLCPRCEKPLVWHLIKTNDT